MIICVLHESTKTCTEIELCADQFKFQDTCNHTTENPMGRPGATAYVKVSKKYCDSKGMDYPGAWYEQIVSHIMTALLFVLSNAVTFYICWYKKALAQTVY